MASSVKIAIAILLATGAAMAPWSGFAQESRSFPTKPVRLITGGAGSQNDLLARLIGAKLNEAWGQPVVIENRPGVGGAFAASIVAKAAPDGYTLLLHSSQFAIGAALHTNLPYNAVKDFTAITQLGFATVVLVVSPSLGVKSAQEFIDYARARPGKILFSSAGAGSGTHLNGERFRFSAGIKAVHVGMKSSPEAVLEIVAGRIHYCMAPLGPALPFIKEGKLLALGVANPTRLGLLPDVPTMAEVLPGYERDGSFGLLAPAGTPRPILIQINKDVRRVFELSDVKERLSAMGFFPAPTTPEEFDKIVRNDIETFRKVARFAGLTAK